MIWSKLMCQGSIRQQFLPPNSIPELLFYVNVRQDIPEMAQKIQSSNLLGPLRELAFGDVSVAVSLGKVPVKLAHFADTYI